MFLCFNIARNETGNTNDAATYLGTVRTELDEEAARRLIDECWQGFICDEQDSDRDFIAFLVERPEFVLGRQTVANLAHILF